MGALFKKIKRKEVTFGRMRECMDALHLLFGGENERH